jgi:FkbM family methyltransferase
VKFLLKKLLQSTNYTLVRHSAIVKLWNSQDRLRLISEHLTRLSRFHGTSIESDMSRNYAVNFQSVQSQLLQEIFVISTLAGKSNGYFVEAGASDGIDCSNTFLLEKEFGWSGILIEPSVLAYQKLDENRAATSVNAALWSESELQLSFTQTISPGLSTLSSFRESDFLSADRKVLAEYKVPTITLVDLLVEKGAPKIIDYLSLDTEGSEYEILRNFDFDVFGFNVISVEHDWNLESSYAVASILRSKGYVQVLPRLTEYESWFVGQVLYQDLRVRGFEDVFLLN